MTEIKDPILSAMEFSLNYTLKRFEDTETEDGKIIREGIIRGKTLVEHLRIFGADVYGKSKEQFAEDIKDKTNIVMMTDEEYKEYIKAKRLYRVIKKGGIVMDNIKRGEMFYISRGGASYSGSEQHSDRPAVIVSNNKNNENSNVVEIVYMTTQPKTDLPTHVTVRSTGRPSTVLCEQVYSVSTERIGTYIGECTDKEMENIDIALMISLQLDGSMKTSKKYNETIKNQQEEIELYRSKIQAMEQELKEKANVKPENTASSEETIRLQTERDTYKTMYEQLLNRLVNGGAA